MASFSSAADGVHVHFDEHEASLLRQLLAEMATLLEAEIEADPVNHRLFPDAYESDEDSRSYKDLVGYELRSQKIEGLRAVQRTVGEDGEIDKTISQDDAAGWLAVLNDIRLAVGTRNDVTEEKMSAEPDPDDPSASAMFVLHWLGWVQEEILELMNPKENA
jgi:Domain of unknown function (DUF2017)